MAEEEAIVGQARRCGHQGCGTTFWICEQCDRGQRYCSPGCRQQARAERHRQANHRYQCSPRGRRKHSLRQCRYRHDHPAAKIVTDTGSQPQPSPCIVNPCLLGKPPGSSSRQATNPVAIGCMLCGRPVAQREPSSWCANESNRERSELSPMTNPCDPSRSLPEQTPYEQSMPAEIYIALVLSWYVELPDTPDRANVADREQAQRLFARGISGETAETALLLGALRRLCRSREAPPLPRIRSLAYFVPVLEELLKQPVRPGYLEYLRRKMADAKRIAAMPEQPR